MSLKPPAYRSIIDVEEFVEAYPEADSPEEALEYAERARSTTDRDLMEPRCSECFSVKVREKKAHRDIPNQRPEPFYCVDCNTHLWETMPSVGEIREKTRDDLPTAARHAARLAAAVRREGGR